MNFLCPARLPLSVVAIDVQGTETEIDRRWLRDARPLPDAGIPAAPLPSAPPPP